MTLVSSVKDALKQNNFILHGYKDKDEQLNKRPQEVKKVLYLLCHLGFYLNLPLLNTAKREICGICLSATIMLDI